MVSSLLEQRARLEERATLRGFLKNREVATVTCFDLGQTAAFVGTQCKGTLEGPEYERESDGLKGRCSTDRASRNGRSNASRTKRATQFRRALWRNVMSQHPFKIKGMDVSGYMVKDAARAITFYRDVLGLEPAVIYPDNRGAEYELADGTTFGLWGGGGAVMPFQPSNGILFAVDDFDAAVAAVRSRDIPVIMEHESAVCFMAMINDTEGNMVTLHKRKAP
jgi:predicted enzyme related to lactoylglutathione lyase